MKRIKYISGLLITTAFAFSSCTGDLDLNPKASPSSAVYWQKPADFEYALASCYATMQSGLVSYGLPTWDNLTDNSYCQHNYWSSTDISQGNISPSVGGFISGVYSTCYSGSSRVNIFLKHLAEYDGISASEKNDAEAQARMIRAYFYSYLYRCYGEVPIVKEPLTLESQDLPKSPKQDVLAFIMEDIDFAINNLQDKTYSQLPGRWTKDAAKAFRARLMMYDSTQSGNQNAKTLNEVINLLSSIKGYKLADNFSDNFTDLEQESCPEIIMSVKFLAPNNYTEADMWYGDWIVNAPIIDFLKQFEMNDGSPAEDIPTNEHGVVQNSFTNEDLSRRDPRMAKTIFLHEYIIDGNSYKPSNAMPTGAGLAKFLSPNGILPFGYSTMSQQDWVIMRYADVLLMLAEATNEVEGPNAKVYNYVNKVRERAGMPTLRSGLDKSAMREAIRHERRIELAFEGEHYFDLKRWRILGSALKNTEDKTITRDFKDIFYEWPIPQSQIDKSDNKLTQNPNYK